MSTKIVAVAVLVLLNLGVMARAEEVEAPFASSPAQAMTPAELETLLQHEAAQVHLYKGVFEVLIEPRRALQEMQYAENHRLTQAFLKDGWQRCAASECPSLEVYCEVSLEETFSSGGSAVNLDADVACHPNKVSGMFVHLQAFVPIGHFQSSEERKVLYMSDFCLVPSGVFRVAEAAIKVAQALEK